MQSMRIDFHVHHAIISITLQSFHTSHVTHHMSHVLPLQDRRCEMVDQCRVNRHDVLIIGYAAVRTNAWLLNKVNWDLVVVDEVHSLANPKSAQTKAAQALLCKRRIGLTGTVMSNSVEELFHIVDFCRPGALGSFEVVSEYLLFCFVSFSS
jgi:SNF2 family DNA or RNA helicase